MARGAVAPVEGAACDYTRLSSLDNGLILTTMDPGPRILGQTGHTVVAASYHRNQQPMADSIAAFTGTPDEARQLIAEYEPDYVVACLSANDFALYRTADEDNFANMLAEGEAPAWLSPVRGFEDGSLRVWRVTPGGNPSLRR